MAITSRHNPLVTRFRDAARGDAGSAMLLDGAHLVADALAADIAITLVAITPAARQKPDVRDLAAELSRRGVEIAAVTAPVMDAISPVRTPSGIVALADRPSSSDRDIFAGEGALAVIAVDVQDPGNIGAIVRVAEAAGATGVVAAGATASPFGWKALRGSMGSAFRLPIAGGDPAAALAQAQGHGCRVVATVPRGGRPLFEAGLVGPLALLVGGEGPGLPATLIDAADERVMVPMRAPVESLNAAVTAAVVLYEAIRQRQLARPRGATHRRNERAHEKTTA
jgi:RNA methyltransferase, TrmH family